MSIRVETNVPQHGEPYVSLHNSDGAHIANLSTQEAWDLMAQLSHAVHICKALVGDQQPKYPPEEHFRL